MTSTFSVRTRWSELLTTIAQKETLSNGNFYDLEGRMHSVPVGRRLSNRADVSLSAFHAAPPVFIYPSGMPLLTDELNARLAALRQQGLYRELRRVDSPQATRLQLAGQSLLNFSSNDYLGLASHPALREAAVRAIERYGVGSGASRLVCGSLAPFHELEEALADFKGTEAALTFATGYAAASGTIGALMGRGDIIILDKLVHACIVDAARASGATLRVFDHNDLNDLAKILEWADAKRTVAMEKPPILIITESIFSMDGDAAPLREIVGLKEQYGAWLMVDEAHGTGLYGAQQRGLAEELGVSDRIEIQMGTLGKALGSSGGFICGSRALVDYLVNRARSFIFSTAPLPAAAAAATAALHLVQSPEGRKRREMLFQRVNQLNAALLHGYGGEHPSSKLQPPENIQTPTAGGQIPSAIVPYIIGEEMAAVNAAQQLREQGFFIPAIRYPTVARGQARLRITLTADHTAENVAQLLTALTNLE
jgi:8-amino-7-oxononanoate synthase